MLEEKHIGLVLALASSVFIGISFVITKKGLIDASKGGIGHERASDNFAYLRSKMWWMGVGTMGIGELANFAAYSFAPAILVTPLGACSVLISSVLASVLLGERLSIEGKMGCALSIIGAIMIILHAPEEAEILSVDQIIAFGKQPGFVFYFLFVVTSAIYLIFRVAPRYGRRNMLVYISICSLVGSISVMACKGVGIALKLSLQGHNQLTRPATWVLAGIAGAGLLTQMNYFNKALDRFSTNLVSPIYYVLFTTATITASALLYQGFYDASSRDLVSVFSGFITIFIGVFLLNSDKDTPRNLIATAPSATEALHHAITIYDDDRVGSHDHGVGDGTRLTALVAKPGGKGQGYTGHERVFLVSSERCREGEEGTQPLDGGDVVVGSVRRGLPSGDVSRAGSAVIWGKTCSRAGPFKILDFSERSTRAGLASENEPCPVTCGQSRVHGEGTLMASQRDGSAPGRPDRPCPASEITSSFGSTPAFACTLGASNSMAHGYVSIPSEAGVLGASEQDDEALEGDDADAVKPALVGRRVLRVGVSSGCGDDGRVMSCSSVVSSGTGDERDVSCLLSPSRLVVASH